MHISCPTRKAARVALSGSDGEPGDKKPPGRFSVHHRTYLTLCRSVTLSAIHRSANASGCRNMAKLKRRLLIHSKQRRYGRGGLLHAGNGN